MPENDFEKQVQRLFDEMRIKPSEKVWPQIETRVKRDKNRRRFFLWLPAALVALVIGGYWFAGTEKNVAENVPSVALNIHESPSASRADNDRNSQATAPEKNRPPGENAAGKDAGTPGKESEVNEPGSFAGTADHSATKKAGLSGSGLPVPVTSPGIEQHENNLLTGNKKNPRPQAGALMVPDNEPVINNSTYNTQTVEGRLQQLVPRLLPQPEATGGVVAGYTNKNNQSAIKLPAKKNWEWGFTAGAGVSSVDNGSLAEMFAEKVVERSPVMSSDINSQWYNNQLAPQSNTLYAAAPPSSSIKRDFSWKGGGFIKRKLTSRFSLSTGLLYHQYTTNRIVGDLVYSNNNAVNLSLSSRSSVPRYSGAYQTGKKYTNHYHFAELPLGFDWQVTRSNRFPVYINAGLQLSYLLSTNGLHYDTKSGAYFEDRNYFKKLQTGIYAGVSTKLLTRTPYAFNIGPVISYNTTNLTKPSLNVKQNLVYAGLNVQWSLKSR